MPGEPISLGPCETSDEGKDALKVYPLFRLTGLLDGVHNLQILKDDGCNVNAISRTFFARHFADLQPYSRGSSLEIRHSSTGISERAPFILRQLTLRLPSGHTYTADFAVGSTRYDAIIGMPWHVEEKARVDYSTMTVATRSGHVDQSLPHLPSPMDSPSLPVPTPP